MELEGLWGIATILGPIVLLALFVFVILRNRTSSRASEERTEQATKANYAAEDATEANYQAEDRAAKKNDL
jgi:uncharacterized membrane protein